MPLSVKSDSMWNVMSTKLNYLYVPFESKVRSEQSFGSDLSI